MNKDLKKNQCINKIKEHDFIFVLIVSTAKNRLLFVVDSNS
jgi:hypothetical protein